jgi:hypothetical protein
MFSSAVLILCGFTSLISTILLLRGYRRSRSRLLLWSGLGFIGLAIQNIMLFIDLVLFPELDMSLWRNLPALLGLCLLLFGLIWELG